MRAANAQGAPYEVVLNLKIEPVVRVPVSPDNDFSIDLSKYLESSADAATIATEPNATWVAYARPTQRIAGRVPAGYNEPRTLITVNVMAQKGGTYVRYFGLVRAPVPVVPLVLGGQLSLQLVPFLLEPEDVVASVKTNPNSTWVNFNPGPKILSGTVPRTLDNSSVIITALATSFTQGLDYSFQLELYIQDSSKPDTGVLVPVVASNNFTIITSKYFPASVRLSAITTVPQVNWISFDPAKSTVSGKVPDLVAGTVVRLTVNASSAATPGSEAATYSKLFNLEVQLNDVPKFNVTLGAQFGIDIGAVLLSPPGDYLTSISTLPISNWVSLGTNGKTIGGVVPLTLPAGTSVAVAGTAFNPSLDSSYNRDFSLEIGAGYSITVPVLIGGDFQINLTDYLRSNDDTVKFTTSPPVDWVKLSPTPPPSLIGTVPAGYDGNELNITILATSRSNGFTYTILATIQMFTNEAQVEIFQADILTIDLRPLLKTPEDLIESIQKFPVADWLELNTENRSVSGTVPLNQPAGSSVNITVNGLSLQEPSASIGRLRGGMRAINPRQLRLYFPYSVLVSVKIFDRPVVSSSTTLSATVSLSSQPPRSTPPQSTGPDGVSTGPNQPTMSAGSDSSAPAATQPSAATLSSDGESGSPSTPVFPPSSGGEGPTSSNDGGQQPTSTEPTPNPSESNASPSETGAPELKPGLSRPSAIVDARVVDFCAQPVCRGAIVQPLPPSRAVSKLAWCLVSVGHIACGQPAVIRRAEPNVCRTEPIASSNDRCGLFGLNPSRFLTNFPKLHEHRPADLRSHVIIWCSVQPWRPVFVKRSWNIVPRGQHFGRGLSITHRPGLSITHSPGNPAGIEFARPVCQPVSGNSLSKPIPGNTVSTEPVKPVCQPIPGNPVGIESTKPVEPNEPVKPTQPVSQSISGNSLGTKPVQPRWPGTANFCVDECSADPITHAYDIHKHSTGPVARVYRINDFSADPVARVYRIDEWFAWTVLFCAVLVCADHFGALACTVLVSVYVASVNVFRGCHQQQQRVSNNVSQHRHTRQLYLVSVNIVSSPNHQQQRVSDKLCQHRNRDTRQLFLISVDVVSSFNKQQQRVSD
ncbi:hypothetical protein FJTKL_13565 [Diaporthe vaccinii]|uniref:Uncharacterized protein n=1 Tax=Diaporthe vaccinii TaxID=105482 RepID=A0ABR4EA04_9PEZI